MYWVWLGNFPCSSPYKASPSIGHSCSFKINLLHCMPSTCVSVDNCSAMVSPQAVEGTLLHHGVPLPPCSPLTSSNFGVYRAVSQLPSPLIPQTNVQHFLPIFKSTFLRCHCFGCWAQPCPVAGPWEPAGTVCMQHRAGPALPSRGDLHAAPAADTLSCRPNTLRSLSQ